MDNTGRRVKVDYIGTFDDGWEFDSTYKTKQPIEFICMDGMVIQGLDEAVRDMEVGETKKVHVPMELAYGEYDPQAKQPLPVSMFPDNGKNLPIGEYLFTNDGQGGFIPVRIAEVNDEVVMVDVNNPLAGHDLNFEITLVESEALPELEYPDYELPGQAIPLSSDKSE